MSNSPHLGKWYKANKDDGFDEINIIEVDGDIARSIGKNYTISELQRTGWLRKEHLAPDPFAIDLGGIDKSIVQPKTQTLKDSNEVYDEIALPVQTAAQPVQNKVGEKSVIDKLAEKSKHHKFIIDAINLSDTTTSINVDMQFNMPCDLHAMKLLATTLNIEYTTLAEVLSAMVYENYSAQLQQAFNDAIVNVLLQKDIIDEG